MDELLKRVEKILVRLAFIDVDNLEFVVLDPAEVVGELIREIKEKNSDG